jgi:hypothetical protein
MFLWGLSSCVVMFEPAPFEALGLAVLFAALLRPRHADFNNWRTQWMQISAWAFTAVFMATHLVALLVAGETLNGLVYALVTFALMVFGLHLGGLIHSDRPSFNAFVAGYVIAALFSAALAIVSLHPFIQLNFGEVLTMEGRPKALFKDPNVLGPYLVPAVAITWLAWHRSRSGWMAAAHVLLLGGTVATGSRGAWLNVLIVLLLLSLTYPVTALRYALRGALLLMALAGTILAAGLVEEVGIVADLYETRLAKQDYDSERLQATANAIRAGFDHPTGVGPAEIRSHAGNEPHNTLVKVMAETGLASLVAMLAFFAAAVVAYFLRCQCHDWPDRALGGLCFALFCGQFVNTLFVDALHWRHYWIIVFAFAAALQRQATVAPHTH